jgi:hypothetical protein
MISISTKSKKAADLPTEAKRSLLRKTSTEDEIIAGIEPDGWNDSVMQIGQGA